MADDDKRWTIDITISQRMLMEANADPMSKMADQLRLAMDAAVGEPARAALDAGCGCAMIGPELVEESELVFKARVLWTLLPGTERGRLYQFRSSAEFDQWVLDGMPL